MDKAMFVNSCVNLPEGFVHEAQDNERTISYRTFTKYVSADSLKDIFPMYQWGKGEDLRLKDDYSVSFHKTKVKGKLYYYVCWSCIEFFFLYRNY